MGNILLPQLFKWVLFALLALVLYGVLPTAKLAVVLGLFVVMRLVNLASQAVRKPMALRDWQAMTDDLARKYERFTPDERATEAALFKLVPTASVRELAEAQVREIAQTYRASRSRKELFAEGLGVVGFVALLPTDIALYTRDFFSLQAPQGWIGTAVATLCVALYAWPHLWSHSVRLEKRRILWWAIPFLPALFLLAAGIGLRHPYLNPFHPEHNRLAAERVLALQDNVVAGRHADWVMRYACQLDEQGDQARAVFHYREALRLDPNNQKAYARLTAIEATMPAARPDLPNRLTVSASAPFWAPDETLFKAPRCRIASELERVEGCSVVLVSVGEVPDLTLDAIGHAITNELQLPVYISTNVVPLPQHTRVRGLLTGRQWEHTSMVRAFQGSGAVFPKAPIKYLLITPVDIYTEGANYVFSTSYEWGGVLSLARYGPAGSDGPLLRHRAAKQSLCVLLKSFRVPPSPNRDCVTSYAQSLQEFDAKGNRPAAGTLAAFRQAVAQINNQWRHQRTAQ